MDLDLLLARFVAPLALAASVFAAPTSATACDPAPNYSVTVMPSEAPDCLVIEDAFDYDAGALRVDNQCEEAVSIEGDGCEACGEALQLEPGEQGRFVLEDRDQPGETDQSVTWSLGDMTGTLATRVHFQDNSGACDGWDEGGGPLGAGGCHVGSPRQSGPWMLGLGLGLLLLVRRSA